jgi:hypothetical protein
MGNNPGINKEAASIEPFLRFDCIHASVILTLYNLNFGHGLFTFYYWYHFRFAGLGAGGWSANKDERKQEKKRLNRHLYNMLELKHGVDKEISAEPFTEFHSIYQG